MKNYKCINSGEQIRLHKLISSVDIDDDSLIEIYGADGRLITRGEWYRDWMLDHIDEVGVAWNPNDDQTVHFLLRG